MLLLTKLDKSRVLVTLETIKYIEQTPDTLVRFLNGESIMVREKLDEISALADAMRRRTSDAFEVTPTNAQQTPQKHFDQ